MKQIKNAIVDLLNRYRIGLGKCRLLNTFATLAVAGALILAGSCSAAAEDSGVNGIYPDMGDASKDVTKNSIVTIRGGLAKRIIGADAVAVAGMASASLADPAETKGIYVAPKFLMTWQNNRSDMIVTYSDIRPMQLSANMKKNRFAPGGALAVGYDFSRQYKFPIRAELEFAMRGNNKISDFYSNGLGLIGDRQITDEHFSVKFNASTLLANFYWDFHNATAFTPYITAGAGLAFINAKHTYHMNSLMNGYSDTGSTHFSQSRNSTNFAWALGVGCAYEINKHFAIDLGYRYLDLGKVNFDRSGSFYDEHNDNTANFKYKGKSVASNHEIMLGLRYTF